ncbi:MAG: hypothetical protein HOB82_04000 [Alphaproteobacteria bacterium]|nr:hypothetical protein [Alphaproteobacteria bacterium]
MTDFLAPLPEFPPQSGPLAEVLPDGLGQVHDPLLVWAKGASLSLGTGFQTGSPKL